MIALEVGELLGVTGLGKGLESSLDQLDQAAAENSLLAKEVLFGLLGKGRLEDSGTAAADTPAIGQGDIPGIAGSVLGHAGQIGHAGALGELTANDMSGSLGGAHDDVDVLGSLDVAVVDVEAMGEGQGIAGLEVGSDELFVDLGLGLIGGEDHDDVGLGRGLCHAHDLEAGLGSLLSGRGALAQADADVAAGVHEIERVGVALRAVADDGDFLSLDDLGLAILVVVNGNCHFLVLLTYVPAGVCVCMACVKPISHKRGRAW